MTSRHLTRKERRIIKNDRPPVFHPGGQRPAVCRAGGWVNNARFFVVSVVHGLCLRLFHPLTGAERVGIAV